MLDAISSQDVGLPEIELGKILAFIDALALARPDLHLTLWNPYQALDVVGPTVVTWGFAPGALAAAQAWLEGRAQASGRAPQGLQ